MLQNALGNVARGDRFWDRVDEVADLKRYVNDGASVLVVGPRRIGKTSIVHRALEQLTEQGMRTTFADAQAARTPAEFLAEIAVAASPDRQFLGRLQQRFQRVFKRVQSVEVATLKVELTAELTGTWPDRGRDLLELLAADGPHVLAVDELPILFNRLLRVDQGEAETLLNLLRKSIDGLPDLRLIVSGSIGLEPVLHRAGLSGQITYLTRYEVGPWDEPTTTAAVHELTQAEGLELDGSAARTVHARLGAGVPYHVLLYADAIRVDAAKRGASRVTADDVSRIYQERLLSSVSAQMLHLESRLGTALGEGPEFRLALDALTETAVSGVLTTRTARLLAEDVIENESERHAALRSVLDILEHDAYLRRHDTELRFASRLVKDWWKERHSFGFITAEERQRNS